jgi:hypothetical protein
MAEKAVEVGLPHEDQDFYLASDREQNSRLGKSTDPRLGGTSRGELNSKPHETSFSRHLPIELPPGSYNE